MRIIVYRFGAVVLLLTLMVHAPLLGQQTPREVRIAGVDGLLLRGVLYTAPAEAPAILLLHQCDREGMPTGYEKLATLLSLRGFHVLMLDFRGYGGSKDQKFTGAESTWEEAGKFFESDTEAAYQFLISQSNVLKSKIGVVGSSCGVRQAILLAERHSDIGTFVFLSGTIRDLSESALALNNKPVLSIASEGDTRFAEAMRKVFDHSKHPESRFVLYKGEDHGTPLFNLDKRLEPAIVEWLELHLNNK
ncbi:MAG: alpha/beta hydrolase [Ignavibacteriae bacterium]|nr:alpha/beta hydrolase [Ignavibacteriota bacterium]